MKEEEESSRPCVECEVPRELPSLVIGFEELRRIFGKDSSRVVVERVTECCHC